jgi:hypothetical protein
LFIKDTNAEDREATKVEYCGKIIEELQAVSRMLQALAM